jgi:poly-gamma-glutamate capsule biosynthesis protein CapA/YwtB (metallophosphatase superfamily)
VQSNAREPERRRDMPYEPTTEAERRARREARRRQIRRRRLGALTVVGALASLALALGVWAAGGDQPAGAEAATPAKNAAVPKAAGSAGQAGRAADKRSLLGSGKPVTLAFGGDIHFESPIREKLAASPASVLAPIAPVLSRADVAMVNLETAVTDRGVPAPKEYVFRAPTSAFSALRAGGVDVATIANNHGMDFGTAGLRDTLKAAKSSDVALVGAGRNDTQAYAPYRTTVNGQRIAIIGATQVLDDELISAWTAGPGKIGLASAKDEPRLVRVVRKARKTSDTVVVYVHWGVELTSCPTSVQKSLADKLVAAGADVVVGSHAHVLLGTGTKRRALVSYGLGNFVFYASRPSTTESGVLEVTVTGRKVNGYRWVPAQISGGIPYPRSGSSRAQAVASWKKLRSCTDLRR